jgi:putative tryptophan/tyrosine transport system substrate-binding protein
MKRREFIMLASAAAAWPFAVRAQRPDQMRRIGVLMNLAADDPQSQAYNAAFLQGLQEFGWTVGRNIRVESRYAEGSADRIRKYAAELVALAPDVILTSTSFTMQALQQATQTIPIVFVQVVDPIGGGFAASLAHPGGNATGLTVFEYGISAK